MKIVTATGRTSVRSLQMWKFFAYLCAIAGTTIMAQAGPDDPGGQGNKKNCARTYTFDAGFDEGFLLNLNHDPNHDQLQINDIATPLPFVYIACSTRGTAVRIDINTGVVLGEFRTAPDGRAKNPSRTTVDLLGNCWVGNRSETAGGQGSVMRIGVVIGGIRTDAAGTPDASGQYLQGPFDYNTCQDRDGDNLIRTSTGLADILDWNNAGGIDDDGGVDTADDECIINYVRTAGTAVRTVAVDGNNDLWVGGLSNRVHEKIDGTTGLPVPGTQFNISCGGYGGLVGCPNVLWSARNLVRADLGPLTPVCIGDTGRGNYGLGIDPNTGNIWYSSNGGTNRIYELDPTNGNVLNSYVQGAGAGFGCQGVVVTGNSHVWVAKTFGDRILHYAPNPNIPGTHFLVGELTGFVGSTGVACDSNGKIWVSEMQAHLGTRVDPNAGPLIPIPGGGGSIALGAIDMNVSLGAGAGPYNYSDMTGKVVLSATSPSGTWTVTHDGGQPGVDWGTVSWNGSEPAGTQIKVAIRASDNQLDLPSVPFMPVQNGIEFCNTGVTGQFLEIQVTLCRPANEFCEPNPISPILFDLTVECCDRCSDISQEKISCNPDLPGTYDYNISLTNLSGVDVHRIRLLPCDLDGDLVPDFTITPSSATLSSPLANGASLPVSVKISGVTAGEPICFEIWMFDENFQQCCVLKHCVEAPNCCFEICEQTIECIPGTGRFKICLNLRNLASYDLDRVFVWPNGDFMFTPDSFILSTVPTGEKTGEICFEVEGPDAQSGSIINFDLTTHESQTGDCCGGTVSLVLPECCDKENECFLTEHTQLCQVQPGSDELIAHVRLTVCNYCDEETQFEFSLGDPIGAITFTPASGTTPPIAPGDCVTITIEMHSVIGAVPPGGIAIGASVSNPVTGEKFNCRGRVYPASPDHGKVGAGKGGDEPVVEPVPIPFGEERSIQFVVTAGSNHRGAVPLSFSTRIGDQTGPGFLSLDGLPPGQPVTRSVDIPPGETRSVTVNARFVEHSPFLFQEIVLNAVFDDGRVEVSSSASLTVRSVIPKDCNRNQVPDDVDIAIGASADADGDGVPDECQIPVLIDELTFRRGDSNEDGRVDLSDGIDVLSWLFLGQPEPTCLDASDSDDSGRVDLADAVVIFRYLFLDDSAPSAPGPLDCGSDPTIDGLDCVASPACEELVLADG